jgi:hypothetical protein
MAKTTMVMVMAVAVARRWWSMTLTGLTMTVVTRQSRAGDPSSQR